jgi:hypothetical protein
MEPNWMKQINSVTVCNLYYIIFVIYAVLAVITVLNVGYIALTKLPLALKIAVGAQGLIMAAVLVVLSLFQYIVCDRALLSSRGTEGFYGGGLNPTEGLPCNVNEDCPSNKCSQYGKCVV